jgi:hypothetical protein
MVVLAPGSGGLNGMGTGGLLDTLITFYFLKEERKCVANPATP